jgi:hypothetical protein
LLGKIDSPLDKKLSKVEWGEFKIGDLFKIQKITKMLSKEDLRASFEYPVYSSDSNNNGIIGYTNEPEFICDEEHPVYVTFGDHTRTFNIAKYSFSVLDNVKVLEPCTSDVNSLLYMVSCWKKQIPNLGYSRHWKVAKNCVISLPITNGKEINFDFISSFIAELEAERIKELEAYLKITGFDYYELTKEEQDSLAIIEAKNVQWREFKMEELFEKISTIKLPYKAKELPEEATDNFVLPCLTSSFKNQGLNYYAPKNGATILKDVISIPSNSDVYRAYFQSKEFTVLSDAYAIRWKDKSMRVSQNQYLFMVMCINKFTDLPIYSYKNKLGGWNVVKNKYVLLPVKKDKIDFDFIETFINAIKKITLKDVAEYADKRIAATKEVIQNKKENSTETINNNSTSNDENYNKKGIQISATYPDF